MNVIIITGQLGRDPELKTSAKGVTYLQNSIYEYAGKDEEGNSTYTWRDFVAYGTTAETIARNLNRRGRLTIIGEEREKTFTDKNGQQRTRMEITTPPRKVVNIIDFAEKPKDPEPDYTPQGFAAIDEEIPF